MTALEKQKEQPYMKISTSIDKSENTGSRISPPIYYSRKAYLISIIAISPPYKQLQKCNQLMQETHRGWITLSFKSLAKSQVAQNFYNFINQKVSVWVSPPIYKIYKPYLDYFLAISPHTNKLESFKRLAREVAV
ncbi:hypothetical protein [Nostoc parmelioides]|uniref:Uncharacterized protein n=1 Tax=Nostoc parmelioides FACHB-3921 TaxID=2692909 RepID=A0ABR8BPX3_9NOSO|nr:hypothetical protein [Nostoc parmelioides]MBD2255600.1 hypothetical protein [Nostoc parmelioides FACHB-3921]